MLRKALLPFCVSSANARFIETEGRRLLSSRVRRPVVGSKPGAVPEESPEPVKREAVPEHIQLFAEFFADIGSAIKIFERVAQTLSMSSCSRIHFF